MCQTVPSPHRVSPRNVPTDPDFGSRSFPADEILVTPLVTCPCGFLRVPHGLCVRMDTCARVRVRACACGCAFLPARARFTCACPCPSA